MFGVGKSKKKNQYAISLDIGTEFVKALIFRIEGEKGYVVGVGRERQRLSDMQGGTVTDIAGVISNCEKALKQAAEHAGVLPRQVIIGIAGELVKGLTTHVHYVRPNSRQKIGLNELQEIVHQVQSKALEQAKTALAWETGHKEIDVRLVNSAVVEVKIDGYRVTNPIGFYGKDVSVGVFNSFAPIVHLGALQTIAEELGLDLLSIAAEPYAVSRCLGMEESVDFSAIFIDVGGGTTDIAVVRNGGVEGTKMFAIGGRSFTKRVANTLSLGFVEAEEMKINYANGLVEGEQKQALAKAIKADAEVWLSGVELTLEEFAAKSKTGDSDLLPTRILLCGGGSMLPEIYQTLKEAKWSKSLPFPHAPKVEYIMPKDVVAIADETGVLKDQQDVTPMGLANLAIDFAGVEGVVDSVLEKVTSGLKS
ncbi:MAG: cell division FtsA domain-containing protein [Patescibacteria group bacterium]|jgi:cell division protein FtsA